MTVGLNPIFVSDSQLLKVLVYDADGVTLVTPLSCVCEVYNADTNAIVQASAAGTVGAGYAQYNWAGIATAANYEAVLTVTISAGVIKTEHFRVTVRAKPPAFTNDPASDIGKMRLELGDDVEGNGVRPDGANLTDAQIQALLDREGVVMPAVAAACETLARQWARVTNISAGGRSESLGDVSERWAKMGKELRAQYGGGGGAVSADADRQDAYADEADTVSEFTE